MKITIAASKPIGSNLCGKTHLLKGKKPLCGSRFKDVYPLEISSYLPTEEIIRKCVSCKKCRKIRDK